MNMRARGKGRLATLCGTVVVLALVVGCGPDEPRPVMVPVVRVARVAEPEVLTVESARRFLRRKPNPRAVMRESARYRAAENREAVFLMVKYAALRGLPEAEYELGRRYDPKTHSKDGIVLRSNVKIAAEWFKKAANGGHIEAMARLGELYKNGEIASEGNKNATELGLYWLGRAAKARRNRR